MEDMRSYARQRAQALKARAVGEADEVRAYARSFLTSRIAMGVAAAFLVAFGAQTIFAPTRLPPIGMLGLADLGLVAPAPSVKLSDVVQLDDLGITAADIDQQTSQARAAAKPYLSRAWDDAKAKYDWLIPVINVVCAFVAGMALLYTMKLQTKTR